MFQLCLMGSLDSYPGFSGLISAEQEDRGGNTLQQRIMDLKTCILAVWRRRRKKSSSSTQLGFIYFFPRRSHISRSVHSETQPVLWPFITTWQPRCTFRLCLCHLLWLIEMGNIPVLSLDTRLIWWIKMHCIDNALILYNNIQFAVL